MGIFEMQKHIFGSLFILANRLQVVGDQYMSEDDMTMKQWLLTATISQFGDTPPTLSEVADIMGSSRQNVKQLAIKLEEKGFLRIEKDEQDARALRLKLTGKSYEFWEKREDKDRNFIMGLFESFSLQEIDILFNCINKLSNKIDEMGNHYYKE